MTKIVPITDSDYGRNPNNVSGLRIRITAPDYKLKIDKDLPYSYGDSVLRDEIMINNPAL